MNIQDIVDFNQANTAPERYRPAQEKVLKGDPEQTVFNHYNSPCGQMNAGVWEGAVGQWTVSYTEHEYCEIVQGFRSCVTAKAMPRPCAPAIASSFPLASRAPGRCWSRAARSM